MATVKQLCVIHLYICIEIDRKKVVKFLVQPCRVKNYMNPFFKIVHLKSQLFIFLFSSMSTSSISPSSDVTLVCKHGEHVTKKTFLLYYIC
jgi:hypothetical protein